MCGKGQGLVGKDQDWRNHFFVSEDPRKALFPPEQTNPPFSLHVAEIQSQLRMVSPGEGGFTVFVGLNGSREELGLEPTNYFMFPGSDLDGM